METKLKQGVSRGLAVIFLLFSACNYYKPVPLGVSDSNASKAKSIKDLRDRVFIVQSNKGDFLLTDLKVDIEKEELEAILSNVPILHRVYLNDEKRRFNNFHRSRH